MDFNQYDVDLNQPADDLAGGMPSDLRCNRIERQP
jgi:hypothetical protein